MSRAKKLDVGMKCIKRMLFILNTIFLLIGILLTAIGSTIHAVYSEFEAFIESYYFRPVALLIFIGVTMIVISVIGYTGTIKKSTMIINLYYTLLFLLLIFEISLAIIGFVMSSNIFTNIKANMVDALNNYTECNSAMESWDLMQDRLHCCGVDNPYNWASKDILGPEVKLGDYIFTVPKSCCKDWECNKIYERGCVSVLGKYASDSTIAIGCCSTVVLIVQIFGIIFAAMLAQAIRRAKTLEEMTRQQNRRMIYEQLVLGQDVKVVTPVLYTPSSTDA